MTETEPRITQASALDRTARYVIEADRLAVLTGAGMSADSGVPTYRDALTGYWARFDPLELATPQAFERDPARVFGWYMARLRAVMAVEPHDGYRALATLAARPGGCPIVTQNIDGFHRQVGSDPVFELHGSLQRFRCAHRAHPYALADILAAIPADADGAVEPPTCGRCSAPIRPGVVWFGETLPADALDQAIQAVTRADVVLLVGTSSVVYPAAELPLLAHARGATVIEINPERTPFSTRATVYWAERAAVALPALVDRVRASAG